MFNKKNRWLQFLFMGLVVISTWIPAIAADSPHGSGARRGGGGFLAGLDRTVGLTPEQRDAVRGLLAEQRQASQSLREQTDGKIRAVLTPDQQKKFDGFLTQQKNARAWHPANN